MRRLLPTGPLVRTLAIVGLALLSACAQRPSGPVAVSPSRPASYEPPGPPGDPWGPYIREASDRFDVPERWIREVMRQESGGRATATSRVGAMGLMQVMPGTYAELRRRHGLGTDAYHPWDNIMAGTAYIREMYESYGSPAFLAAYNAGPRRVEGAVQRGRALPPETRNYLARVAPRIEGHHPRNRASPQAYAAGELPPSSTGGVTVADASRSRMAIASLPPPPRPSTVSSGGSSSGGLIVRSNNPVPGPIVREPIPARDPEPRVAIAAAPAPASPPGGFFLIPQAMASTLPRAPIPVGPGGWGIQVGAFASENLARSAAESARGRVGASAARATVMPVRFGSTTLYRARVTGLSRGDAESACANARDRTVCIVLSPDSLG